MAAGPVLGRADLQVLTPLQAEQYEVSVQACVALARVFVAAGYDVALETVFEPEDFAQRWRPLLAGLAWHLVVLRPSLPVTLAGSRARTKRVIEEHTIAQHQRTGGWSADLQLDTSDLSVERTLEVINNRRRAVDRTKQPRSGAGWASSSARRAHADQPPCQVRGPIPHPGGGQQGRGS